VHHDGEPAFNEERIAFLLRDERSRAASGASINLRVREQSFDRQVVDSPTRVRRPASVTVAAGVERRTSLGFNRALPFVFVGLLVFGVVIGGQALLTSTVEEKSSRVIEVLL
jgi:ABC-2 type transport system permease protein